MDIIIIVIIMNMQLLGAGKFEGSTGTLVTLITFFTSSD